MDKIIRLQIYVGSMAGICRQEKPCQATSSRAEWDQEVVSRECPNITPPSEKTCPHGYSEKKKKRLALRTSNKPICILNAEKRRNQKNRTSPTVAATAIVAL